MNKALAIFAIPALACTTVIGQTATTLPADDGPDPGLAIFLLLVLIVLAGIVLLGAIIAVATAAVAAGLLAIGVLSMATLVAILHRSAKAGVSALIYQVFGLAGLLVGCVGSAGICWLRHTSSSWMPAIIVGGVVGVMTATGICWCMLWLIHRMWLILGAYQARRLSRSAH